MTSGEVNHKIVSRQLSDKFQLLVNLVFSMVTVNLTITEVSLFWYMALKKHYFYCLFQP